MPNPWDNDPIVSTGNPAGNPWDNDPVVDVGGRDEIVGQYANEILRRNEIYRTIPQEQLADPDRLYKLAELEAQRNEYKPIQPIKKQDKLASFATGYGQGGTFGFSDELSGAVDFVGGAGMGVLRGEGLGAIESGKKAYSDRVEKDRRVLRQARVDNPVSTLGGELAGGIITYAPAPAGWMGSGARTTSQVAAQAATKADKLRKLSQTGNTLLRANRASRATNLSAKAAQLSRPAANFGEAAARFGGRVAESVGKGMGYGAAYGGLYGLGSAEGDIGERLDDAAKGAAYGAVGGAVLSPAVQFVVAPIIGKAGYSLFTSLDNKALDKVLQRAERSGTSLQKVRADFDAWAKTGEVPETLAELMGPHERSLLSAMITVNRETEERAGQVLLGRGKKEVDRLEKSFARAMGAKRGDFQKAKAAAQKARSEDPEAFYQAAHYEPNGQRRFLDEGKTRALSYEISKSRVAQSTLRGASDYADARGLYAVRDEIDDFARALEAGKPPQRLSVEAADYIERSVNQRYKSAVSGGTQDIPSGIKSLRDRLRGIIDDTGLGEARATAAERIRRGELLDEGRKFMEKGVDVEDINNTLRGNPALDIAPASPAGQQAYTVGAARAIADELRSTQEMKGFADATRKIARTPAIREKVNAVLPQKLTKKGLPSKAAKQTRLNQELDQAIERTADRADFTNTMLGNSRTAFRQGAVQDALADDHISAAVGDGLRDLLIGGPGNVVQQAVGKWARTMGARVGQPGIMRPGLNRAMADILLATNKDIPVQIARLAARAAQRANGKVRIRPIVPPQGGSTPPSGGPMPAGPVRGNGLFGFPTGRIVKRPRISPESMADHDQKLTNLYAGGKPPPRTPRDAEIERLSQVERDALQRLDDLNNEVIDMGVDPAILQERRLQPSDVSANAWPRVQELQAQMDEAATQLMRARDGMNTLRNAPEGDAFGRTAGARPSSGGGPDDTGGPVRGAGFMGFGKKPAPAPAQSTPLRLRQQRFNDLRAATKVEMESGSGGPVSDAVIDQRAAQDYASLYGDDASDLIGKGQTGKFSDEQRNKFWATSVAVAKRDLDETRGFGNYTQDDLEQEAIAHFKGTYETRLPDDLETLSSRAMKIPPRSNGLGALKADAGPAAIGGFIGFNQDGEPITADNIGTKMRNALIGAGGFALANRIPVRSLEAFEARTAGVGGKRPPKMDKQAKAIQASVSKIAKTLEAKGITPMPQQPEMRVGKGLAKLAGIADDPKMSMQVASDMLKAGRSPEEIWQATNRIPIKVEGRTILMRAPGSSPEEVQAAFWQEMAKPYSKRAPWAQTGTEDIRPIGPNSIARKPANERLEIVGKQIAKSPERARFRKDIWEESGVIVIGRNEAGQMVAGTNKIGEAFKPVALLDGSSFKTWKQVQAELDRIVSLPRAKQPKWYTDIFSEPLNTALLRKVGKGEYTARKVADFALKRPAMIGLPVGGGLGVMGVALAASEIDKRQKKKLLAQ